VCNHYSTNDLRPAVVTQGRMAVTVQPASVVRGSHAAVTVTAKDADTGAPVTGAAVSINGAMLGVTGQGFTFSPPLGLASANGVVQNPPAYQDSVFAIGLTDPPPVQPQTTDVHLNLGGYPLLYQNTAWVTAQDVHWKVVPQWGTKETVNATGEHTTAT